MTLRKKSRQARGITGQNNLAHSFSFKADAEVKTENNHPVTEGAFRERQTELAAFIDKKFGALHPTAKRPRPEPKPQAR